MSPFLYADPETAEWWIREGAAPHGDLYGCYWGEDYDLTYEADYQMFGTRLADGLENENGGPEYRRWEREQQISLRYLDGFRV